MKYVVKRIQEDGSIDWLVGFAKEGGIEYTNDLTGAYLIEDADLSNMVGLVDRSNKKIKDTTWEVTSIEMEQLCAL